MQKEHPEQRNIRCSDDHSQPIEDYHNGTYSGNTRNQQTNEKFDVVGKKSKINSNSSLNAEVRNRELICKPFQSESFFKDTSSDLNFENGASTSVYFANFSDTTITKPQVSKPLPNIYHCCEEKPSRNSVWKHKKYQNSASAYNVMKNITIKGKTRKPCSCSKSFCLKLYCECFANGEYCTECNCQNCKNNDQHESERTKARKICQARNPEAFSVKISSKILNDGVAISHTKGCNCRRSGCLKNYCECYEAKVKCTSQCKCVGCKNFRDTDHEPTPNFSSSLSFQTDGNFYFSNKQDTEQLTNNFGCRRVEVDNESISYAMMPIISQSPNFLPFVQNPFVNEVFIPDIPSTVEKKHFDDNGLQSDNLTLGIPTVAANLKLNEDSKSYQYDSVTIPIEKINSNEQKPQKKCFSSIQILPDQTCASPILNSYIEDLHNYFSSNSANEASNGSSQYPNGNDDDDDGIASLHKFVFSEYNTITDEIIEWIDQKLTTMSLQYISEHPGDKNSETPVELMILREFAQMLNTLCKIKYSSENRSS